MSLTAMAGRTGGLTGAVARGWTSSGAIAREAPRETGGLSVAVARVAWFDGWVAFSETRGLWAAVSVESAVEILWKSAVFVQRGEWPWGGERNVEAGARHRRRSRTASRRWGKRPDWVRKFSHSTEACDRSVLSGIAVQEPGHPVRTLFRPCGRRRHCSRGLPLGQWERLPPSWRAPLWSAGGGWHCNGSRKSPLPI